MLPEGLSMVKNSVICCLGFFHPCHSPGCPSLYSAASLCCWPQSSAPLLPHASPFVLCLILSSIPCQNIDCSWALHRLLPSSSTHLTSSVGPGLEGALHTRRYVYAHTHTCTTHTHVHTDMGIPAPVWSTSNTQKRVTSLAGVAKGSGCSASPVPAVPLWRKEGWGK